MGEENWGNGFVVAILIVTLATIWTLGIFFNFHKVVLLSSQSYTRAKHQTHLSAIAKTGAALLFGFDVYRNINFIYLLPCNKMYS